MDIFGSPENETLRGTRGNDTISGVAGHDTLFGGPGEDIFLFDNAPVDKIKDFTLEDKAYIIVPVFGEPNNIDANGQWDWVYTEGGRFASQTENVNVLYNPRNGRLWLDTNGDQPDELHLIGKLPKHLHLTQDNFILE